MLLSPLSGSAAVTLTMLWMLNLLKGVVRVWGGAGCPIMPAVAAPPGGLALVAVAVRRSAAAACPRGWKFPLTSCSSEPKMEALPAASDGSLARLLLSGEQEEEEDDGSCFT